MIEEELFTLEREAERRVREAGDREIGRGGPGSGRRALEAMDTPMLEVAPIRDMRRRFGDLRMEIDHHNNLLRKTERNQELPSDVKRHRTQSAEERLAALAEKHRTLEAESFVRFPELRRRLPGNPTRDPAGAGRSSPDGRTGPPRRSGAFAGKSRTGAAVPRQLNPRSRARTGGLNPDTAPARGDSPPPARDSAPAKQTVAMQASAVMLPGGATLRPETKAQAAPIDWARLGKALVRGAPRAASGAAAGLGVLLTPSNIRETCQYFSDDERLRIVPGDLDGTMEKRDPRTGEWRQTGEIGTFAGGRGGEGRWYVTGTKEQVDRAVRHMMSQPDDPLPQTPPLIPPEVPELDVPESFPVAERGPTIHVTPAAPPEIPNILGLSDSGHRPNVIEVFPDQSAELPQFIILENRRGNPRTQDLNADVAGMGREISEDDALNVGHIGGGWTNEGVDVKETYLPNHDKIGGTKGSNYLDIAFRSGSTKRRLLVNTVDARRSGQPKGRERKAAVRILYNKKSGDLLVLVPKPAAGETIDRAKLKEFLRPFLREIDRPHNSEDADAPSTIEWHLWRSGG